jgi:hypothetical protein
LKFFEIKVSEDEAQAEEEISNIVGVQRPSESVTHDEIVARLRQIFEKSQPDSNAR